MKPQEKPFVDSTLAAVLLAAAVTLVGGYLRYRRLEVGYVADEMGWIMPHGWYGSLFHGESAVNPPLLRMVFNGLFDFSDTPRFGRIWSAIAGTAAIPLVFWAGRSATDGRNIPGYIASMWLALYPLAIIQSGLFRTYATLGLVTAWHALALAKLCADPSSRQWRAQLALSALMMPQLHYITVPTLLLEGLGLAALLRDARIIGLYVPAALLFAPLGYLIIIWRAEHADPTAPFLDTIYELSTFNLAHRPYPARPAVMILLAAALWKWWRPPQRGLVVGLMAATVSITAISTYHSTRPDVMIVPFVYTVILLGALPTLLPDTGLWWPAVRRLAWFVLFMDLLFEMQRRYEFDLMPPRTDDALYGMALDLHEGAWPDKPTYLAPAESVLPLFFYLAGRPLFERCEDDPMRQCFHLKERHIYSHHDDLPVPPGSLIVWFGFERREEDFGGQCTLFFGQPTYWVWDCPNGYQRR